jgi:conjugative relaxase-like TrwC/TraI family protein
MLRIHQQSNAADAKSYFTRADYFINQQELVGRWRGEGAKLLGLSGDVQHHQWTALCDGLNPLNGEKLLQRLKGNRTIGYDFVFSVPKSVSLLYSTTKDERLLDAFREAVDETMQEVQLDAQTRVRKNGKNEDRTTGNLIWGEFVHLTSRPVNGVPDPNLHAHCFAFNNCFDASENRWKAGQFRNLKRDAPFYEALFHSRLSHRLTELGLPLEKTRTGWELTGVSRGFVEKFSRRTALIEEEARRLGIVDPNEKAELGAKTRSRKAKHLTMSELQTEWRNRMSPQESTTLDRLAGMVGGSAAPRDGGAARGALDYAISHEFERRSVTPQRQLLATALKYAVGQATPAQISDQFDRSNLIVGDRNGRKMATTREVLVEELHIVDFARRGRGTLAPLGDPSEPLRNGDLDLSQQAAVRHMLGSRDRVTIIRGIAGSGKTTLLREIVDAVQRKGIHVVPLAPSADASRGVLRREGYSTADTVARFLLDEKLQESAKGQFVWVDEAGLLGAKTVSHLFDLAGRLGCRILMTGDHRQHSAVERGSVLQLLEDEAGIRPAEVTEIHRPRGKHKDEYKKIVKALSEGKVGEGFNRLDKLGWIREIPNQERYRQLAADYVHAVIKSETALVIAPTHAEGERVTAEIRSSLKSHGLMGQEDRTFRVLVSANLTEAQRGDATNFNHGDVLQYHQNAKGVTRGTRVVVGGGPLPLNQANRFTLFHARMLAIAPGDTLRITHQGRTADNRHELRNGALYRVRTAAAILSLIMVGRSRVTSATGRTVFASRVTNHKAKPLIASSSRRAV